MRAGWVRAAALSALLQGLAHGALFLLARPTHGPDEAMVVETMRTHVFNFAGAHRSYWQMYFGYGLLAAGVCFVEAALLWLIAPMAGTDARRLAWITGLLIVANLAHAAIIATYFFYPPLVADVVVALLLGLAMRPGKAPAVG